MFSKSVVWERHKFMIINNLWAKLKLTNLLFSQTLGGNSVWAVCSFLIPITTSRQNVLARKHSCLWRVCKEASSYLQDKSRKLWEMFQLLVSSKHAKMIEAIFRLPGKISVRWTNGLMESTDAKRVGTW